jgi:oxaloacetate decarboxylase gamma subunit
LNKKRIFSIFTASSHFYLCGGDMTIPEMFTQSGALAVLGMTMVFGFLVIMVICVTLTGKVIHAIGADKEDGPAPQAVSTAASDSGVLTAVISAAVTEHRKNN